MPVRTMERRDGADSLGWEQAIAFFTQFRHLAQTAPDRIVLGAVAVLATGPPGPKHRRVKLATLSASWGADAGLPNARRASKAR
jgi:hypothetical protein